MVITRVTTPFACRVKKFRQWLGMYSMDPNIKLHPPRSRRPESERTFAASNYHVLLVALNTSAKDMSTFTILSAVKELIKIYAPNNWGRSFLQELNQSKKHESFADNVGVTAQYLCKSGSIKCKVGVIFRVRFIISVTLRQGIL